MKLARWLSQTPVLLVLLAANVTLTGSFGWLGQQIGPPLLDFIQSGEDAVARVTDMTHAQRSLHFWTTVGLDTLYPLAYVSLLMGLAFRMSPRLWMMIAVPAVLGGVCDLGENTVQAIALSGGDVSVLILKSLLTPAKFGLLIVALLALILVTIFALWRRFRQT